MPDLFRNIFSSIVRGIRIISSDPIKAAILFAYLSICMFTWRGLIFRKYLPLKSNLLIGEKFSGRVSHTVDSTIPVLSPYGYDSQFSWILSLHPFPVDSLVAKGIDHYAYRSQRLLLPFLTWMTIRDATQIVYGLWFWCSIGVVLGIIAVYKLSVWYNVSPVIPLLAYILNPGLYITTVFPMPDGLACSLTMMALYCWLSNRYFVSSLLFALTCLTKEYYAFIVFYLLAYAVWKNKVMMTDIKKHLILLGSLLPMLAWQFIIRYKTGEWSFSASGGNFDWPFSGIYHCWARCCTDPYLLKEYAAGTLFYFMCGLILYKMIRGKQDAITFIMMCLCTHVMVYGAAILESDWSFLRVSLPLTTLLPISLLKTL